MSWLKSLFSNKPQRSTSETIALLEADLHSHLIPGIDDGAASEEESLALIRKMMELGYTRAVTTPHIYSEQYPNESTDILARVERLKATLKAQSIDFELEAAAEYFYDEQFEKLIASNDLLTFGDNYLLFETSHHERPLRLEYGLFDLQNRRIKPILAHPERYGYAWMNPRFFHDMKERGIFFQLNIISLTGIYSPKVKKSAYYLLKNGMIDFLGSDAHHLQHLQLIPQALADPELQKYLDTHTLLNSTLVKPKEPTE